MDKRYIYKKVQSAVYTGDVRQAESQGQAIIGWSPNNLRKLILSTEGVIVQWYTTVETPMKTKTQMVSFKDQEATMYALMEAPHNYLKVLNQYHKFSNLEEVIILPTSNSRPGLQLDPQQLLSSLDVKSHPRLAAVVIGVEPMDIKEFTVQFKSIINSPTELVSNNITPDMFSVKQLNTQFYNSINLRGFYYELDANVLGKHLKSIQNKFDTVIDNLGSVATLDKEALASINARNKLLEPVITDALLIYTSFLRNKHWGIIPKVPEASYFLGDNDKTKGYVFLQKLGVVTETPGSNMEFLDGLYTQIKVCVDQLLAKGKLQDVFNLEGVSIQEYLPKVKKDVLPLFIGGAIAEVITKAEGFKLMDADAYTQLCREVAQSISNDPEKAQRVWNTFIAISHLTNAVLTEEDVLERYETLPREWKEYIGYNILLNDTRQDLYASCEEPIKLLQLTAVPAKHFKEVVQDEEVDDEQPAIGGRPFDMCLDIEAEFDDETEVPVLEDILGEVAQDEQGEQDPIEEEGEDVDETHISTSEAGLTELTDKRKQALEEYASKPIRTMWQRMGLDERIVETFIEGMEAGDDELAMLALINMIGQLKELGPGVVAYLRGKYNLDGSIVAVGQARYSGVSVRTAGIVTTKGKASSWDDVLYVGHHLTKKM